MSDFQAVKERVDIVDFVGQYVTLKRRGREFWACCPFHQEKTPSFAVNPARQTWRCFGSCNEGGDVFRFLQKRENLTPAEALREVARQTGFELSGPSAPREDYSRLTEANEAAAQYFRHLLLGSPAAEAARAYVARRGVDEATGEAFGLGYALDSFGALREHLIGRGFSLEELVQAGLLTDGERGAYDRFRDRLIFPIRDERGRAIGFGGRVLGDGMPKYLNSPQTALFDKSATLYALDRAGEAVRTAGSAVVVEGYMDAIAAHQHGIRNVVATLGTALTERHVQLLKRYTKRVTLAMDADAAGQEAMSRGLAVLDATAGEPDAPVEATVDWTGMVRLHAVSPVEVAVFTVPTGKDPDELIRSDPEAFARLAEQAVPPFDFRLRHELSKVDRANPRALVDLVDRLLPVLDGVSDRALQARYLSQLATATGAREDDLRGRLRGEGRRPARDGAVQLRERAGARRPLRPETPTVEEAEPAPLAPAHGPSVGAAAKQEMFVLRLLFEFSGPLRPEGMLLEEDLFADAANRLLFQAWRGAPSVAHVPDLLDEAARGQLRTVLQMAMPISAAEQAARALADAVARMRLRRKEERTRLLAALLHEAESATDRAALLERALRIDDGEGAAAELAEEDPATEAAREWRRGVRAAEEFHRAEMSLRRGETSSNA